MNLFLVFLMGCMGGDPGTSEKLPGTWKLTGIPDAPDLKAEITDKDFDLVFMGQRMEADYTVAEETATYLKIDIKGVDDDMKSVLKLTFLNDDHVEAEEDGAYAFDLIRGKQKARKGKVGKTKRFKGKGKGKSKGKDAKGGKAKGKDAKGGKAKGGAGKGGKGKGKGKGKKNL